MEAEDSRESVEELSVVFSASNFHRDVKTAEDTEKLVENEDEPALDIGIHSLHALFFYHLLKMVSKSSPICVSDDIEIEDAVEKPKEQSMLGSLNKQKLANTFNSFKGQFPTNLHKRWNLSFMLSNCWLFELIWFSRV